MKFLSQLANNGFYSWTHIDRLGEHERSSDHRQALFAYLSRRDKVNTLHAAVAEEFDREISYWRKVPIKKSCLTVKFLTLQRLALKKQNGKTLFYGEWKFSQVSGTLSEYDPFLADHVQRFGRAGSGVTLYMSFSTYEEFVELMADKVRNIIVSEVKQAKNFSLSIDSTPDITNIDQLTFTLRLVIRANHIIY